MEDKTNAENTIQSIIADPGVVVVVGGVDTGKTTFTRQLVNAAVEAGIMTAIVDCDTGQSEVGPPAAISMATLDAPVESLRELRPRRMYFVGDTTPAGNLLPTVIGTKCMVDDALERGAALVVVDSSGLVNGEMGRKLKYHKIELVSPKHIVGIRKRREIDHIMTPLARMSRFIIHEIRVSPEAQIKSKAFRAARRQTQFYDYFKKADRQIIRMDDITCLGTMFTTGRSVNWQHYRTLEQTLRTKILHAEIVGDGMYIVVKNPPVQGGVDALVDKYNSRQFTVVTASDFGNLLVGLSDSNGRTLDLGILEAIDFGQRHMSVITPIRSVSPIKLVQFGALRIRRDGIQISKLKPGDI